MKYNTRLLAKMALIFFGLLFLVCVWLGRREKVRKAPEGDKIKCRDVEILMDALDAPVSDAVMPDDGESYLTYAQYIAICRELGGDEMNLPDYADRYEPDFLVLKEDWYKAYRIMLAYLDKEASVWETTAFILKIDAGEKRAYTENGALSPAYSYHSPEFEENVLRNLTVFIKGNSLLTVVEELPQEHELKNVWVTENADGMLECFYHQTVFYAQTDSNVERECIADLTFSDGKLIAAKEKNEKVHGKLLWLSKEQLEIEGCGIYPLSEDMEVYKLYGSLETLSAADLRIGYADTDYVIERGKVCACLVSEKEAADMIRVLLKNTANNSNYYDAVELMVDGEHIRIEENDLKAGERRSYRCAALTDKITVYAEGVVKEDNAYRGTIECYRNENGMMLINELPLEEYLYAVVPSEMPASYPSEALKAQAICARTYAYLYILHAGLPEVGAHVDDTTSYQVYHNIKENAATTTAVKETDGMLLTYEGEPAQNYYYSTSCGVGTDAGIWKSGSMQDTAYMQASRLNITVYENAEGNGGVGDTAAENADSNLRDEDNFRRFITAVDENDLECDEPWYRWTYTVSSIDADRLLARMKERYAASPQSVLTKTQGDYYVSEPIAKLGKISDISIGKRGAGGVADELLIVSDTGTYKILAEYNIRYILCDRTSEVTRQDGSTVVPSAILPSGFFVIETGKEDENVIGYTLTGGGYGHGVGMSQNGAKALGYAGADCRQILEFFFAGCELTNIAEITD
ncbi:MAG: SpoIID/LytB domain-containing protein [Lachnospiraceae bacterium]|nr:SpoIID/LytB domain-containing protein [Lachnospiraceae bacterium]